MLKFLILLLLSVFPHSFVQAQFGRESITKNQTNDKDSDNSLLLGFTLQQVYYPTDELSKNDKKQYSNFAMQMRYHDQTDKSGFKLNSGLNYTDKVLDLRSREIYWRMQFENLSFDIGQKLTSWSTVDEVWNLGLWQSVYQRDPLSSSQQGMLGLHLNYKWSYGKVFSQVSPVFLPNINPEKSQNETQIESNGRWFRPLNPNLNFIGRETPVEYEIQPYSATNLMTHNSVAIGACIHDIDEMANLKIAYADKPMNEYQYKYKAQFILNGSREYFTARVQPVVGRHKIVSAELVTKIQPVQFYYSWTQDNPEKIDLQSENVGLIAQQRPKSLTAQALGFVWQNLDTCRACQFSVSYLQVKTERVQDYDETNVAVGSILPYRSIFENSIQSSLKFKFYPYNLPTALDLKVIRDLNYNGQIFQALYSLNFQSGLVLQTGVDLIGVDEETSLNRDTFYNQFRANDRVYAGIQYGF